MICEVHQDSFSIAFQKSKYDSPEWAKPFARLDASDILLSAIIADTHFSCRRNCSFLSKLRMYFLKDSITFAEVPKYLFVF